MPAKKNKKISSAKKTVNKKIIKKLTVKKPTVKKPNSKKPPAKKSAQSKAVKKTLIKKTRAPKKEVKKSFKPKTQKVSTKKVTLTKKSEVKKFNKKSNKHSLAKAILARVSVKQKNTPEAKYEAIKPTEKKLDSAKKIILVRKGDENLKLNFKVGDYAIYPSHGVGKIAGIEKTSIAGQEFSCYLMSFEREKLTIKIPASSAKKIGLRHPISKTEMDEVFSILRSGIKKLKGMWSRRAQEYETKINSGDIILLAEVIRDLTRDIEDSERSYSERIIYETAIYRLASEYAAIYKVDLEEAKEKIITTAKDKLSGEPRSTQKDDFDDFDDFDREKSDGEDDEEESEEDEDEDDEDGDFDFDDEDEDDAPKKRKKRK